MKILKITLRVLLMVTAIVMVAAITIISILRKSGVPDYNGEKNIEGLNNDVRVIRDERGVPHIYASDAHDLYYITGYISAQERMWQMDLIRRATKGELAEIFGKDYAEADYFLRALSITKKSKMILEKEDTTIMAALQAYTDGVNTWIKERGRKLPPEFRMIGYTPDLWTLEDVTNIIGYMGWDLASSNLSNELNNYRLSRRFKADQVAKLIPDWKLVDEVVYPGFELNEYEISRSMSFFASLEKLEELGIVSFSGSNNWAVSGERSETGKPILANDMHLGLGVPGTWIQMHQVIPGELNVTGVVIPGQPFVVAGHNEKMAWGMTNLGVDDIDLFVEKVDSSATRYFFNGEWFPLEEREEIINIKGGSSETRKIKSSHHGPVISGMRGIKDAVLTLRWSGFDFSDEIKGVYLLDRAQTWNDFRNALSNFRSVSQNFVYADTEGNIGLNTGGGVPLRKGAGMLPRSGETDEYDWKGYVPFELLPFSYNPADGFVSSANQRTTCSDYPFFISGDFAMPFRILRIREMAAEKEILGMEDFRLMITDNHSSYAGMLTPAIIKASDKVTDHSGNEKTAIDALKAWNYSMDKSLIAPTLFEFIRIELARKLMADELSDLYGSPLGRQYDFEIYRILIEGSDEWIDNINTPETETLDDLLAGSIRSAVDTLEARYGKNTRQWEWGKVHRITLEHPMGSVKILDRILRLNSANYGIGGSYHTVEPYTFNSRFKVIHGASERHIFNTADWDQSLTVIPTGTSGVPGSRFYLSQTETYLNNGFYNDPFTAEAVEKAKKFEMIFKPLK